MIALAPPRMLVLWVSDWPAVAAGAQLDRPAAVVRANRVLAATPAARDEGVELGIRRREAQARCPAVEILPHDPAADARAFEPVVAAVVERITPRVEVIAPGQLAFPTRGPSRYHGGDAALADLVVTAAVELLGVAAGPTVGVADGRFTALLAAMAVRAAEGDEVVPTKRTTPLIVAPGSSRGFLDGRPVNRLGLMGIDDDTIEVFRRLGLRTLGDVATLPVADIGSRFGVVGATAHRLANGLDAQPPMPGTPPPDHTVRTELDPPAEQVETVAFVARGLADDLAVRLEAGGLTCTRLLVVAETDHGERHERRWRGDGLGGAGTLTAAAIVDRVRWQLDGWLRSEGSAPDAPTAGITLLELAAEEVVAAGGRQLGFWGRSPEADDGAVRAVARVAGLLGLDAVAVPGWRGSRDTAEQLELLPAAALDLTAERPTSAALAHRHARTHRPGQPVPSFVAPAEASNTVGQDRRTAPADRAVRLAPAAKRTRRPGQPVPPFVASAEASSTADQDHRTAPAAKRTTGSSSKLVAAETGRDQLSG